MRLVESRFARVLASVLLAALTGAGAALLPALAGAQEATATPEVGSGVAGFDGWDWLNLGVRLVIVLLVIWGAVIAMRWWVRRSTGAPGLRSARHVEVLETRALGPNRALHLVRLGDRAVLIGATQERISALLEIDDAEQVALLAERPGEPQSSRSLRSLVGGLGALSTLARERYATRRAAISDVQPGGLPLDRPLSEGEGGYLGVRLRDLTGGGDRPGARPAGRDRTSA